MSFVTIVTTAGLAKLATAVATSTPLPLTQMAVGDGNGNPTTPTAGQTALVRERYRGPIAQAKVDPNNANRLIFDLQVPMAQGGWTIHEVGIFDNVGALIAVANFPATYKPLASEGSASDLTVRIYVQVSNASSVTVQVDPAIVIASQSWVIANFSLGALIPGGTTNQVLRKKSNANGDTEWVDPAVATVIVEVIKETQTLTAGQTIVDLAQCTTVGLAVYIEGAREEDWTPDPVITTRLTLGRTYPTGTQALFLQNDPINQANVLTKAGGALNPGADIVFDGGGTATGIPTPVAASDAANKAYVDSKIVGLATALVNMQNQVIDLTSSGAINSTLDIPWDAPIYNTAGLTISVATITLPANGVYRISGTAQLMITNDDNVDTAFGCAAIQLWDNDGSAELDRQAGMIGVSSIGSGTIYYVKGQIAFTFITTVGGTAKNVKLRLQRIDNTGGALLQLYGRAPGSTLQAGGNHTPATRLMVERIA